MHIRFLGTGTSQGIPVIGCECNVCASESTKDKRLRSSVFIEYKGQNILIDIGPDFRQQMLREKIEDIDLILLTHEHFDHVAGLDDIRSINFKWNKDIPLFSSSRVLASLKKSFAYMFVDNPHPSLPRVILNPIELSHTVINEIKITPVQVMHGKLPILAYRINNFAYVTDAKEIKEKELEKLLNLDCLVINALRKREHYSHLNLEEAINLIYKLNPKKAYLTHIGHLLGKSEDIALELPQNIYLAYDGLTIKL